MEVIFSDNKTYIFTEYQLIRIPYFEILINSSTWLENKSNKITINHNSIGFDFVHIFATMDEIDILDPGDNYLFVMKQCDYFCYDKLKILLDSKYGFRKIVSDINNIGKEMTMKLKYLGGFNMYICICSGSLRNRYIYHITPLYENKFYTNDDEINKIYENRYKSKMSEYYIDLLKKIYGYCTDNNIFVYNHNDHIIQTNNTRISPELSRLSNEYFYKTIKEDNNNDNTFTIIVYEKI